MAVSHKTVGVSDVAHTAHHREMQDFSEKRITRIKDKTFLGMQASWRRTAVTPDTSEQRAVSGRVGALAGRRMT